MNPHFKIYFEYLSIFLVDMVESKMLLINFIKTNTSKEKNTFLLGLMVFLDLYKSNSNPNFYSHFIWLKVHVL